MLSTSVLFAVWGVNVVLLIFILVKLNRVTRYFYTPEQRKGPGTKYPPIPKDWRPAHTTPPIPKSHKPHHRRRSYGRHN